MAKTLEQLREMFAETTLAIGDENTIEGRVEMTFQFLTGRIEYILPEWDDSENVFIFDNQTNETIAELYDPSLDIDSFEAGMRVAIYLLELDSDETKFDEQVDKEIVKERKRQQWKKKLAKKKPVKKK